jgi:hypothetical protein
LKEILNSGKCMEKEQNILLMVINILGNGKTINNMVLVYFLTKKIKQKDKENGKMEKDIAGLIPHKILIYQHLEINKGIV